MEASGVVGSNFLGMLNLALPLFQLYQDIRLFEKGKELHYDALHHSTKHHEEAIMLEEKQHLQQLETNLKEQIQALGTDLTLASKEADRDMWEQRNTQFQTLMLAATVMFGGGLGVITQGQLPENVHLPQLLVGVYGVSLAFSFGMLLISVIASMAILKRMCKYMYNRARNHAVNFSTILENAFEMFEQIGKGRDSPSSADNIRRAGPADDAVFKYHHFVGRLVKQIKRTRKMEERVPQDVDDQTSEMSFPDFWDTFCKSPSAIATNLFYAGTMALLVAVATLISSQLYYNYDAPYVAVAFIAICTVSSVIAFYYHCRFSSNKGLRPPKLGPRFLEYLQSATFSEDFEPSGMRRMRSSELINSLRRPFRSQRQSSSDSDLPV